MISTLWFQIYGDKEIWLARMVFVQKLRWKIKERIRDERHMLPGRALYTLYICADRVMRALVMIDEGKMIVLFWIEIVNPSIWSLFGPVHCTTYIYFVVIWSLFWKALTRSSITFKWSKCIYIICGLEKVD